ncbi:MAG: VWA domain-containing protein [Acidobacteria bacterium]|nr:VWA domain-containing protein [Acidobacteriota bacterium]
MTIRAALVGISAAAVLTGTLLAAHPQERQQQPPVFRTRTELIEIDVVVVDTDGTRIHGLTRDDFVLRDRKRPQSIETFTEVQREVERAAELPPLPPETRVDVATNTSAKAGRLVVMVLDDLHVFRGRADTVKEIARKVVNDLGPESSMALIQTGGEHGVEVTNDRLRLLEGVESFKGRRPTRRPLEPCDPVALFSDPETADASNVNSGCDIQEVNANRGLYQALEDAARILGSGDSRRKAFILVSENMAKDLSGLFDGGTGVPDLAISRTGTNGGQSKAAPATDWQLLSMMNAMRRGNVATYSIDPRGEISPEDMMLECHPGTGFGADPCEGTGLQDWNGWVRQAQHGLEIVSEETGGFAVINTDDFTSGIAEIISDLDNYYLLGFYPEDLASKGYRKINVEVKGRPELTLRYRQGYQLEGAPKPPKPTSELNRLIGGALPKSDLPLRLQAIPMPASGKEARVVVALEMTVPTSLMRTEDSDRLLDDIEYGLYAIDMKGAKVRERTGSGAKIALRPRDGLVTVPDQVTYEIVTELRLPPGQYQLRASATSDKLSAGGSVYLSFEVPDFSKADLLLTDLVLAYADGPHVPIARDLPEGATFTTQSLVRVPEGRGFPTRPTPTGSQSRVVRPAPILPFDPTLDRVFTSADTLRLFFRVAQRRTAPLAVTVAALTADGEEAISFTRRLEVSDTPSMDTPLPLTQLAPGAYRLQVTVGDGTRIHAREIGFVVR